MKYKVSVVVTADEFMKLFTHINGNANLEIKQLDTADTLKSKGPQKAGGRVSKVNGAIMGALQEGPSTLAQLKESLVKAGMSPSSLSTGIQALTKAGEIKRVGDGLYDRAA